MKNFRQVFSACCALMVLLCGMNFGAMAQCPPTGYEWPAGGVTVEAASCDQIIAINNWLGDLNVLNGLVAGETYMVTNSGGWDLTVWDDAAGASQIMFGSGGSVTFVAPDGDVWVQSSAPGDCSATDAVDVTSSITCQSCPAVCDITGGFLSFGPTALSTNPVVYCGDAISADLPLDDGGGNAYVYIPIVPIGNCTYEVTTSAGTSYDFISSTPAVPLTLGADFIGLLQVTTADLAAGVTLTYTDTQDPTCTDVVTIDPATITTADLATAYTTAEDACPLCTAATVCDQTTTFVDLGVNPPALATDPIVYCGLDLGLADNTNGDGVTSVVYLPVALLSGNACEYNVSLSNGTLLEGDLTTPATVVQQGSILFAVLTTADITAGVSVTWTATLDAACTTTLTFDPATATDFAGNPYVSAEDSCPLCVSPAGGNGALVCDPADPDNWSFSFDLTALGSSATYTLGYDDGTGFVATQTGVDATGSYTVGPIPNDVTADILIQTDDELFCTVGFFGVSGNCTLPPANDDCAAATSMTVGATCAESPMTGNTEGATESAPGVDCGGGAGNANDDVWYSFVATNATTDVEVTGNPAFDAVLEVFDACGGTAIACADATLDGGTEALNLTGLTVGNTYYYRVYHWYTASPTDYSFSTCVYAAPACAGVIDCNGVCDGGAVVDCAGVCGGTAVEDCNGDCNGTAVADCAGVCGGTAVEDCNGVCNGTAVADCAGVCGGTAVEDCNGVCNGTAVEDCAGVCGGSAVADCDGVCGGTNTGGNPGDTCDDGNTATTNDVYQADGCTCLGTPVAGGPEASIADPCSCSSPNNIDVEPDDIIEFFYETVIITSGPGETWTMVAGATGVLDAAGVATTPVWTENPAGTYFTNFYHVPGTGYSASFTNGVDTLPISNSCDADCTAVDISTVPTMGTWGLMILALLTLNFLFLNVIVGRIQTANGSTSEINLFQWNKFSSYPFNSFMFKQAALFVGALVLAATGWTLLTYGTLAIVDIIGTAIAAPIFAYLLHLVAMINSKK